MRSQPADSIRASSQGCIDRPNVRLQTCLSPASIMRLAKEGGPCTSGVGRIDMSARVAEDGFVSDAIEVGIGGDRAKRVYRRATEKPSAGVERTVL